MQLWHLTDDTPRLPCRVSPGERVRIQTGTWPIEPGQRVWVEYNVARPGARTCGGAQDAAWEGNRGPNSYWSTELGPFDEGAVVTYTVRAACGTATLASASTAPVQFRVGPALYVALVWHQHQPLYRTSAPGSPARCALPWVRLHALRDYYGMAALAAERPDVRVAINLTPVLLEQIEAYANRQLTDRALELTTCPAEALTGDEREEIGASFFDAHWHHQIYPHARYRDLFLARQAGAPFDVQDIRDLQMWFNLAWFATEFREGDVRLVTGETVAVRRFVERGRGFTDADVRAMVAEQYKVLRAVIPLHDALQRAGSIEVTTTPWGHPILPLLIDTDAAVIDRPGTSLPPRFAHPADAEWHVSRAIQVYRRCFGRAPSGMWPAEGAVSAALVPMLARRGIRWIATDAGVLARSGEYGYEAHRPDVLCQPRRAEHDAAAVSVLFRDGTLSDRIGFDYQGWDDPVRAAASFVAEIEARIIDALAADGDRLLTVVLDGENAWGAYPDDGRPFLRALYAALAGSPRLRMVTPAEYIEGNASRGVAAHPVGEQTLVHSLATGSWIDEAGSSPGVDLGTWIGEEEENRAWTLLTSVRDDLTRSGATSSSCPEAFEALGAAEGSDWFWWFGDDQESGSDWVFDDLFRAHLTNVYRAIGHAPPASLAAPIVPRVVAWTFARPVETIGPRDRLAVITNCAGELTWCIDEGTWQTTALQAAGGVMAGAQRHHLTLGPFGEATTSVRFRFRCRCQACTRCEHCCRGEAEHVVRIAATR